MYAAGRGRHGRLGLGHEESHNTPQPIAALSGHRMTKLAAGKSFSLALHADGSLWAWGSAAGLFSLGGGVTGQQQQQQQQRSTDALVPQRVAIVCAFRDIACGEKHAVAISGMLIFFLLLKLSSSQ